MMELKPCPFCGYGGEPEIMTWREPYRSNIVYGVQCMACGAIGEMGKTRELAAKHWNERAERSAEVVDTTDGILHSRTTGELVRCKECRYAYEHHDARGRWLLCNLQLYFEVKPDGFCAWGEKREGE